MATKTRPTEPPVETAARRPPDPTAAELALSQVRTTETTSADDAMTKPAFEPPTSAAGAAATAGAGWLTNKHVLMLWQTGSPMDNWCYLDGGTGWKHGTQANDVAARGLGLLSAGARASGALVHAYEGAGGDIDVMYLW